MRVPAKAVAFLAALALAGFTAYAGHAAFTSHPALVPVPVFTPTAPAPPIETSPEPAAEPEPDAADPEALNATGRCGVERWAVKTGSDADATKIKLAVAPTVTTIGQLAVLTPPNPLPPTSRVAPVETTVYQLHATLTGFKLESDSDYHLVLSDGAHTMIAELASPTCVKSGPLKAKITAARAVFDKTYQPGPRFTHVNIPVTVTGVGFFDFKHGQTGVAPNAIEMHPILSIAFR